MKSRIQTICIISVSLWAISTLVLCGKFLWAESAHIPNRYIDDVHHYKEVYFEKPVILEWPYFQELLEEIDRIDKQNAYLFLGHILTSLLLLVISLAYLNLRKTVAINTGQTRDTKNL